jgi:tetratricopeptide (TPR) repeat protein
MQSSGRKISKKELKEDQLVTYYFKARSFLDKNGKAVGIAVAALLAIVIIVGLIINSRIQSDKIAGYELFQAQMMMGTGDFQTAVDKAHTLMDTYSGTRSAAEAEVTLARAYFQMAEYDSAIAYVEKYIEHHSNNNYYAVAAIALKAASLEQMKKYTEAGDEYKEAADRFAGQFTEPLNLLDAGRCYNNAGNNEKAIECYERMIEKYPDSELNSRALQQLARAGGNPGKFSQKVNMF